MVANRGKKICEILKQIRKDIASKNNIDLCIPECTNKLPCSGTCPVCEAQLQYLEEELENKKKEGKTLHIERICGIDLIHTSYIDDQIETTIKAVLMT